MVIGQGQQYKSQKCLQFGTFDFFAPRRYLDDRPKFFLQFIGTPTPDNFILLNQSPLTFLCEVLLSVIGPLRRRQYVIQGPWKFMAIFFFVDQKAIIDKNEIQISNFYKVRP